MSTPTTTIIFEPGTAVAWDTPMGGRQEGVVTAVASPVIFTHDIVAGARVPRAMSIGGVEHEVRFEDGSTTWSDCRQRGWVPA